MRTLGNILWLVDWHGFLRDAYGVLRLLESQWDCNVSNLHL